ncbi:MAG TPA: DNA topoisomerase IV subunit A [Candidatus Thermoplasmatota archaeon]|nr:DNA topoisomerase IV subunit A [Candidatus Thermoplasmatota archaeon]
MPPRKAKAAAGTPARSPRREAAESRPATPRQLKAVRELQKIAEDVYGQFSSAKVPELSLAVRAKSNIAFHEAHGVWKYGDSETLRSAKTVDGAMMLLRTMYMVDFIKEMIDQTKSSTLREMYYISEGWDLAKFGEQSESDKLAEDLEIITGALREDFKLRPEEDGARVIGNLTIEETIRSGQKRTINCRDDVGDAGYNIPYNVEEEKLRFKQIDGKLVVAVETGGMFDRLVENGFDETHEAILVHLKGQPARSTRRFIKRLNEESKLPVVLFTDGDPWSFRIYASVAYGAIKTAHISEFLATPSAQYLGITPSDIVNYDLPTDKLSEQDVKALEAELTDPRFATDFWRGEINLQLQLNKKSEQQALAKYGLDFVTDRYLPEKLTEMGILS